MWQALLQDFQGRNGKRGEQDVVGAWPECGQVCSNRFGRAYILPAGGLDFQVDPQAMFGTEGEGFVQTGNAFAGPGVECKQFGVGGPGDTAMAAAGACQGLVVDQAGGAIATEHDVEFDAGVATGDAGAQARQRVFRGQATTAAVRDDAW